MIKRLLIFVGILFGGILIYSLLPKPWTNEIESRLYWRAFLANESGLRSFKDKDLSLATNKWAEGLSFSPGLMPLHYNLGLGWQLMSRNEEAVKSYNIPLKDPNASSEIQFDSNFNMGVLFQAAKQTDPALEKYQAALDIEPNSRETKINIELLIQSQQGGGKGEGENKDKKDDQGGGKGDQDQKKDQDGKGDQNKEEEKKEYAKNKPQKKEFKSEQLSQSDVNKILGEIKQQEQKIRAEYNKKEGKEQPRDKDW